MYVTVYLNEFVFTISSIQNLCLNNVEPLNYLVFDPYNENQLTRACLSSIIISSPILTKLVSLLTCILYMGKI